MGLGLALIVGLAAALRLPMLGEQSLWFDEAATAADVSGSFTDMVESVKDLEGSPHFFFFATWLGVQLMGTGEVALRLLSALAGIAVVPVLFATVRRLGGARAGLVAALLAATAPLLVWFSQEARAYQLVVLLAVLTAYCAVRFRDTGEGRAYAGAVVFAVLGIATHYFATLTVVPLVAGMVVSRPSPAGALRWAPAAVPVAGLLLLPLACTRATPQEGRQRASSARVCCRFPSSSRWATTRPSTRCPRSWSSVWPWGRWGWRCSAPMRGCAGSYSRASGWRPGRSCRSSRCRPSGSTT